MANQSFLGGAVRVRSLPEYAWPLSTPVLDGGIIHSPNGDLVQVVNGAAVRFLAVVDFIDGMSRGGHIHPERMESLYVMRGEIDVTVAQPDGHERETITLRMGDMIEVDPGIAHIYRSRGPAQAIEFSPSPYHPSRTVPYQFEPA